MLHLDLLLPLLWLPQRNQPVDLGCLWLAVAEPGERLAASVLLRGGRGRGRSSTRVRLGPAAARARGVTPAPVSYLEDGEILPDTRQGINDVVYSHCPRPPSAASVLDSPAPAISLQAPHVSLPRALHPITSYQWPGSQASQLYGNCAWIPKAPRSTNLSASRAHSGMTVIGSPSYPHPSTSPAPLNPSISLSPPFGTFPPPPFPLSATMSGASAPPDRSINEIIEDLSFVFATPRPNLLLAAPLKPARPRKALKPPKPPSSSPPPLKHGRLKRSRGAEVINPPSTFDPSSSSDPTSSMVICPDPRHEGSTRIASVGTSTTLVIDSGCSSAARGVDNGTYASRVSKLLGVPQIATGQIKQGRLLDFQRADLSVICADEDIVPRACNVQNRIEGAALCAGVLVGEGRMAVFGEWEQGWWLLKNKVELTKAAAIANCLVFFIGYQVFRGANRQKHIFKKDPKALIWGKPPKVIGGKLLASGY
ncbi:sterol c-14 reductase [Canna indica]|uniref:Sterol c-14 reductase n=1 Tax=Canna indica TaxID=4628 RepID=A0AAQ3KRF9_9LILI|nr:sterol c-14 reductase [Canna indica]